ncbi:hypothetical protein ACQEVZ_55475 [Dactylosporangium sp. CA-152071]|uniref:hypothetical protein n=1 Tax=Dactylosporangium sp. CA-152071 TaxID=3239933 RepID=UPI003D8E0B9B
MPSTSKPAVTLHHRTFTIDAQSWTAAYTTARVADLDDALLSFDDALHDHVRRLDRLTVATLFIRARCGALWSHQPHTGIFDTRDGADDPLAVRFNREFVAVGFTDPRHGDCVIVMDATFHGYHLPVTYQQRPGVDWRWLHAVTLRRPARHRWLLDRGLLYNADDSRLPLYCRDDQFIDDPAGTRLRCPSCGAATELTLLPLAVDAIVPTGDSAP